MRPIEHFSVVIRREDHQYVAICPELDIASQGDSFDEARENLAEALNLFLETASLQEIAGRLHHR